MQVLFDRLAQLAVVAWAGGLWAIGYLAAPTLFSALPDDRMLAGMLAGKMFKLMAYAGLGCGFYLMVHRLWTAGTQAFRQAFFWLALLMILLTVVGVFGVQPIMEQLKVQAGAQSVMESVFRDRFAQWHGVSSGLYLLQSLLAAGLVWFQGQAAAPPASAPSAPAKPASRRKR
jgi:hypothetical protein